MPLMSLSNELKNYYFHANKLAYKIPKSKKSEAKFLYHSCHFLIDVIVYGERYSRTNSEENLKKVKIAFKEYVDVTDELIKRYNLDEIKTKSPLLLTLKWGILD
ncbi:hypothetical protein [Clostridium tepidiprofundi]|nr:hypothetical protein [Clostridium tepidiprofundi]